MILSSFLLAVYSVALKYLFSTQDFYTIFIWVQIAGFIAFFQALAGVSCDDLQSYEQENWSHSHCRAGSGIRFSFCVQLRDSARANNARKFCWRDTTSLRVSFRDTIVLSLSANAERRAHEDGSRFQGASTCCDLFRNLFDPGLGGICDLVTLGLAERGFSLRMLSASFLKLT